ncbi:MAG: hypothetical protein Q9222_003124 [Ikaeria aurantiellina]
MTAQRAFYCLLLLGSLIQASPTQSDKQDFAGGNEDGASDACLDYKTCDSKGLQYWNWLQGNLTLPNSVDRTDGKAVYEKFYLSDSSVIGPKFAPEIRQDLMNHGLPDLDDPAYTYWHTSSMNPSTGVESEYVAYKNIINARDGVLIALVNYRSEDEANTLPWSEIMYQTWQDSKFYDEQRGAASGSLSTLQHIIRSSVSNEQTQNILKLMYTNSGYPAISTGDTTWRKWTEEETPNWFFALLGTDNCKGVLFLLSQHAVEAGKKEITQIWTRWPGAYPDIWYVNPICWVQLGQIPMTRIKPDLDQDDHPASAMDQVPGSC